MENIIAGRYRLVKELGKGSSGVVYKAWDEKESRTVAVKLFFANPAEGTTRTTSGTATGTGTSAFSDFLKEIKMLSGLTHPNLIKIFDAGKDGNTAFMVEEYIEGVNIKEWLSGTKSFEDVARIIEQVVNGLAYVHSKSVIHRDIKPTNIIVSNERSPRVKILDFGVAGLLDVEKIPEPSLAGTIGYMSPEQLGLIKQPIDRRSDFYSLGISLYEGLSGQSPFVAEKVEELMHQQIASVPRSIKNFRPQVPRSLDKIILKLLQKDTGQRYQSESGLLADLGYAASLIKRGRMDEEFELGLKDVSPELTYQVSFVGQKSNLELLKDAIENTLQGKPSKLLVSGEVGSGKSRLVREIRKWTEGKGFVFLEGSSTLYSKSIPYAPLSEMLDDFIRYVRRLGESERREWKKAVQEALGELGGLLIKINPGLEEFLGKQTELKALDVEKERYRFATAVANFFLGILSQSPVLLFVDDLQWADESTLALFKNLLGQFDGKEMMLVGAVRKEDLSQREDLQGLIGKDGFAPLEMEALTRENLLKSSSELLRRKADEVDPLASRLYGMSNGNPYFFFEIVRFLVEKGVIYFEDERWEYDLLKLDEVSVPKSVLSFLLDRLDSLQEGTWEVLKLASVWGRRFNARDLLKVFGGEKIKVEKALEEGVAHHVLWKVYEKGFEKFNFSHDKIQGYLYDKISDEDRKVLHRRVGQYLEKLPQKGTVIDEIARHYILAGDQYKISVYAVIAGDKSKSLYANADAKYFYEAALTSIKDTSGADYIATCEKLADVYALLGEYDESIAKYRSLTPFLPARLQRARIYRKIGKQFFEKGDHFRSIENYEEGLKVLGRRQPKSIWGARISLVIQAAIQTLHSFFPSILKRQRLKGNEEALEAGWLYCGLGYVWYFIDLEKDLEAHLKAMNMAELTGDRQLLAQVYSEHGPIIASIPMLDRALRYEEKSLEIRRQLNDEWGIGETLCHLGMVCFNRGEYDRSVEYLLDASKRLIKVGDFWMATLALVHLGIVYGEINDYQASQKYMDIGYQLSRRVRDFRGMGLQCVQMCQNFWIWGDLKRAIEVGEEGRKYLEDAKDFFLASNQYYHLGRAYALHGDFERAVDRLGTSIDYIENKVKMKGPYSVSAYLFMADALLDARDRMEDLTLKQRGEFLAGADKYAASAYTLAKKFAASYLGMALYVKGKLAIARGQKQNALELLRESVQESARVNKKYEEGIAALALGEYSLKFDGTQPGEETLKYLRLAEKLFAEIDSRSNLEKVKMLLGRYGETALSTKELLMEKLELSSFFNVSQIISSELEAGKVLEKIMDSIIEVMGAQRGYLFLKEGEKGALEVRVARNIDKETINSDGFEFSRNVIEHVGATGEPVVVTDAQTDERFRAQKSITTHKLKSILCVPLQHKDRRIGLMYLDNKLVSKLFTDEHLKLLSALAIQAAIAIENSRAYSEVEELRNTLEQKVEDRTKILKMKSDQLALAHQELEGVSRTKSNFIASMTNELRTPLAAIIDYAGTIKEGIYGSVPDNASGTFDKIQKAAHHLMGIINDLIDMSKIESGELKIKPEEFIVKDCVEGVLKVAEPLAGVKGLKLAQQIEVESAFGDARRVTQVLWNLVSNAVKFSEKGSIEIVVIKKNDQCLFSVRDFGIGIPADKRGKVFTMFEQVDPRHKGTGLGLSISKNLIEMQKGAMWFESPPSDGKGPGTKFYFTLPLK
ncbi:MAG: protein kinase [Candidatus Margulisiibacteriota bacterium]